MNDRFLESLMESIPYLIEMVKKEENAYILQRKRTAKHFQKRYDNYAFLRRYYYKDNSWK